MQKSSSSPRPSAVSSGAMMSPSKNSVTLSGDRCLRAQYCDTSSDIGAVRNTVKLTRVFDWPSCTRRHTRFGSSEVSSDVATATRLLPCEMWHSAHRKYRVMDYKTTLALLHSPEQGQGRVPKKSVRPRSMDAGVSRGCTVLSPNMSITRSTLTPSTRAMADHNVQKFSIC